MDDGDLLLPAEVPHALAHRARRLAAGHGSRPRPRDFRSYLTSAQLLQDAQSLEPLAECPLVDVN